MTEITLNDALLEVGQGNVTLERIRELVNTLSVDLGENITSTVLYSGDYLTNINSHDAATSLARQSNSIGIIDNTEVGKF